ncbi:MAG: hypothetical protein AB7O98_00895 [Hyphomonadaceae bacterium]
MRFWAKMAMALAALALLAGPVAAQVPDPYARQLAQRLAQAEVASVEGGYARAAGPFAGSAPQREGRQFTITLRAGQDYRIVGVCEPRCVGLDLRLYDPYERQIAEDVLQGEVPVIHVRPRLTGQYTVEAGMSRCAGAECWFAFNVYSR